MKRFLVFLLLFSLLIVPSAFAQNSAEESIDAFAAYAFGDDLITSRAGKYPTISFRASCGSSTVPVHSKEELIYDANNKLMVFLALFQDYCKTSDYVYADLRVNVFMKFFDETQFGTTDGMLFAFNISPETVLNTDCKTSNISHLLNNGFNLYAHPLMQ